MVEAKEFDRKKQEFNTKLKIEESDHQTTHQKKWGEILKMKL